MEQDKDITTMKTRALGPGATPPLPDPAYPPRDFPSGSHSMNALQGNIPEPGTSAMPLPGAQDEAAPTADASLFAGGIPMDPFSGDPFIGQMVGNCKILEKINEGGSALIYRAHNNAASLLW